MSNAMTPQQRDAAFFAANVRHFTPDEAERYAWLANDKVAQSTAAAAADPLAEAEATAQHAEEQMRIADREAIDRKSELEDVSERLGNVQEERDGLRQKVDELSAKLKQVAELAESGIAA